MYPLIGLRTRGILHGVAVFKWYWYGQRVDKLYYPYNPRSPRQSAMRAYYAEGVANWQGFDDVTKRVYNKEAYRFKLYGYHRYLHHYLDSVKGNMSSPGDEIITEDGVPLATEAYYDIVTE